MLTPFQYLKKRIAPLFGLLALIACSEKNDSRNSFKQENQIQVVRLNTTDGYAVNQLTQKPIEINRVSEEELVTGKKIKLSETVFLEENLSDPITTPLTNDPSQIDAHPLRKEIKTELPEVFVAIDSLESHTEEALLVNDSSDIGTFLDIDFQPATQSLPWQFKDAASNDLKFLDVEHGLPSSYVVALLEDSQGYLWIGTDGGGVCRYNGQSLLKLSVNEGLSDNFVSSLIEDAQGCKLSAISYYLRLINLIISLLNLLPK